MKASSLVLLLVSNVLFIHSQGVAQTTAVKPKIASKSVSKPTYKSTKPTYKPTATASKKPSVPSKSPRIRFDKMSLDLGTIKEDAVIEKTFEFFNYGEQDLVIINAKGSCGCTIPTAPTVPIAPGGKGQISVKYTAKNKAGPQKPTITVTTNGIPSVIKLNMEVWVEQIPGGVN
jgi:hypothetical protein